MSTFIAGLPKQKTVCKVTFTNWNKTVECKPHTNLRDLAIEHDIELYNSLARFTNCQGHGLCGTCTVEIVPQEGVTRKGARENLRFVQLKGNLRLACQTEVVGDIEVTKHAGYFGTKGYDYRIDTEEAVRMYRDEEKTLDEVAQHFKCSTGRLALLLERAGVELRRPGSAA